MTNPKVSEKEMLEWLEIAGIIHLNPYKDVSAIVVVQPEIKQAIRSAIEERGRLREEMGKWKERTGKIMDEDDMREICVDPICVLVREIRDFKLDGEGEE